MVFHSKSVVSFGQLLNALGGAISCQMPVSAMLGMVRNHFAAEAVILAQADARGQTRLFADCSSQSLPGENTLTGPPARSTPLRELIDQYQHVSAQETRAQGQGDYTIWVFRDRAAARFEPEETTLVGIVTAQIARTLDLTLQLDERAIENSAYSNALECLHVGVLIADEAGRVLRMSALAEDMLAARQGLQVQYGKLRATNVAEDRKLQGLLREALACARPRGMSVTSGSGLRTLGLVLRPVAAATPMICVYVRDFDREPRIEGDFVRQILDLTPAEAAMTRRLASGLSLEDAAIALDISRNTARAHLRSIFSKNGITRQTELVRMVLNSAAILGGAGAGEPTKSLAL